MSVYEEHEYRKTATVFARKVEEGGDEVRIYSLEGPAVAKPGDYIVRANTDKGEEWIVDGPVFEATYVRVDDGSS